MKKTFICLLAVLTFFLFSEVKALENIIIDDFELSPRFNKDIFIYNVFVNNDTSVININAVPSKNETIINGNGTFNIDENFTKFTIEVMNENKNIEKYEINVYKNYKKTSDTSSSKLIKLEIKGYDIEFSPNKLNYNINIEDENYLEISYETENDDSKVILTGNENLKYGNNEILITVYSKDEKNKTIYNINVNKLKNVFNDISSDNNVVIMSSSQKNLLKVGIVVVAFIVELILYKILFPRRKN